MWPQQWAKIKLKLLRKAKYKCCYCKTKVFIWEQKEGAKTPDKTATIEHVYPKSDIRRLLAGNKQKYLKIACSKCNGEKGTVDSKVFRDYPIDETIIFDLFKGD